jgi:hypothetical protein
MFSLINDLLRFTAGNFLGRRGIRRRAILLRIY